MKAVRPWRAQSRRTSLFSASRMTRTLVRVSDRSALFRRPLQAVRLAGALQHRQRLGLDLAHALAGHADLFADVLERQGTLVDQAVAELDHAPLAPGERVEHALEVGVADPVGDDLEGAVASGVLDEVA